MISSLLAFGDALRRTSWRLSLRAKHKAFKQAPIWYRMAFTFRRYGVLENFIVLPARRMLQDYFGGTAAVC